MLLVLRIDIKIKALINYFFFKTVNQNKMVTGIMPAN